MITEFKKGYYYRWIGEKQNWAPAAAPIFDGRWRKCIYGNGCHANFAGLQIIFESGWDFILELNNFEERKKIKLTKTEEILKKWK
jgi:hypothetical protein